MSSSVKHYLKKLDEETVKKLLKISKLTELEYWVAYYSYKKRMVQNTCMKLYIGKTTYHSTLNTALAKIELTLYNIKEFSYFQNSEF